jgi:hypothetical protein
LEGSNKTIPIVVMSDKMMEAMIQPTDEFRDKKSSFTWASSFGLTIKLDRKMMTPTILTQTVPGVTSLTAGVTSRIYCPMRTHRNPMMARIW